MYNMDYEKPLTKGFTIYSKSGCINCLKVKQLLKEKNQEKEESNEKEESKQDEILIIDCDEYLIENKENFLFFIRNISNNDVKSFPIIFNDGKFIGGYKETIVFLDNLLLEFEEEF